MWSEERVKDRKWEIKDNSNYFRIVKQGSMLVYLTFHIFSIFTILLSSIVKKSLLSLGYIIILLPKIRSGTSVLEQREITQFQKKDELENGIYDNIEKRKNLLK
jgi:hypothetical protein